MPSIPSPMLASPAGELPDLRDWTIEPKWDGYRVVADARARGTSLWSRNGIDKATQFPDVSNALSALARENGALMLDGELVAITRAGKPLRFQSLQTRGERAGADARTAFMVFDILSGGGTSLVNKPWTFRRAVLEEIIPRSSRALIRRSESCRCGSAGAKKLIDTALADGWEGLIVKKTDAPYTPGRRSPFWRKVKLEREQEFVIGGYTLPTEGADRSHFGALIVGYYKKDNLVYAGRVGTGYTRATLERLGAQMHALKQSASPFTDAPRQPAGTVWIKPRLVAQIRFNELTAAGILRQPVFVGLRDDKSARSVVLEGATSKSAILNTLRCR